MKKTLAALAFAVFGTGAVAKTLPMLTMVECNTDANQMLESVQDRYGEKPFAMGLGNVLEATTMQVVTGNMLMFVNPDTRTYTLLLIFGDDTACAMVSGEDFKPAFQTGDPS